MGVAIFAVLGFMGYIAFFFYPQIISEKTKAENQARINDQVIEFLCNHVLVAFDPRIPDDVEFVEQMLNRAAEHIDSELEGAPIARVRVHRALGEVYQRMYKFETATFHYEHAIKMNREFLGERHRETLTCLLNEVNHLLEWSKPSEAERILLEYLPLAKESLGEGDLDVVKGVCYLAVVMRTTSRYDEAVELLRTQYDRLRKMYGEHRRSTLMAMFFFANTLSASYDVEGIPLLRKCLNRQRRVLGSGDFDTVQALHSLALILE